MPDSRTDKINLGLANERLGGGASALKVRYELPVEAVSTHLSPEVCRQTRRETCMEWVTQDLAGALAAG